MGTKIFEKCPSCGESISVCKLECKKCGISFEGNFELHKTVFDDLSEEDYSFLIEFLSARGNLKLIQEKLGKNYFQIKNALDVLLKHLDLLEKKEENLDMDFLKRSIVKDANCASDIVKTKLIESGGSAVATEYSGKEFDFSITADGRAIKTKKIPMFDPEFRIFNIIEQLLIENGGKAYKGNVRSSKLGNPNCTYDTVDGRLGYEYFGKKDGDSFPDCGFAVIAIMEWAGIIYNKRGYIEFTPAYKARQGK